MNVYSSGSSNAVRFMAEAYATGTIPAEPTNVDADFYSYPSTNPTTWFSQYIYPSGPTAFRWTSGNGYVQSQTSATPTYSAYLFNVSDLDITKQYVYTLKIGLMAGIVTGSCSFEIIALSYGPTLSPFSNRGLRAILKPYTTVGVSSFGVQLVGYASSYKYKDVEIAGPGITGTYERIVTLKLIMENKYATVFVDGTQVFNEHDIQYKISAGAPETDPPTNSSKCGFAVTNGTVGSAFKIYGCTLDYYSTTISSAKWSSKTIDVVYATSGTSNSQKSFMRSYPLVLLEKSGTDAMFVGNNDVSGAVLNGKLYITEGNNYTLRNVSAGGDTNGKYLYLDSGDAVTNLDTSRDVCTLFNATSSANVNGTFKVDSVDATTTPDRIVLVDSAGSNMAAEGTDKPTNYIIGSGIFVYDASYDTLTRLLSGKYGDNTYKGDVPIGCSYLTVFKNRLFASGDKLNPHVWYASRIDDPQDWDYGATTEQSTMAVAGSLVSSHGTFQAITAMIPWENDYMIMSSINEMWIMKGDPIDGIITSFTRGTGVLSWRSYCFVDDGSMVFMSTNGLWIIQPGGMPQPFSSDVIPDSLRGMTPTSHDVIMGYDKGHDAIILVSKKMSTGVREYWWIDWPSKSFWPITIPSFADIYSFYTKNGSLLCGCYDGTQRVFSDETASIEEDACYSHVIYGPFLLGNDATIDGVLEELQIDCSAETTQMGWKIFVGDNAEEVTKAAADGHSPNSYGTVSYSSDDYRSKTLRPRMRGAWACVRLHTTSTFGIERLSAVISTRGRHR